MLILRINNTDIEWHSSPKERFIIDNGKTFEVFNRESLFERFPGAIVEVIDRGKVIDKLELENLFEKKP